MAEPFQDRSASQGGLLSRVARGGRRATIRELETMLARADRLRDLTAESIRELGEAHGVDLGTQLRTPRRNLYRRFLEHCLVDCSLDDEEMDELTHLRELLRLDDGDVAHVHNAVACDVYGGAVEEVLSDHKLDEEEERFLSRLRTDLQMSEADASRMYQESARRSQQRLLSSADIGSGFLASRGAVLELEGTSTTGVEDAIRAVVDEACHSLPKLSWAELSQVRVRIAGGDITEWRVKVRATLRKSADDESEEAGPPS